MVSPDDGARLSARILDALAAAERALIGIIVDALRRGLHGTSWEQQKLAETQVLRRRLIAGQQRIEPVIVEQVRSIVRDAYNHGQAFAKIDLEDAGLVHEMAPDPIGVADDLAETAVDSAREALRNLPDMLMGVYREAVSAGAAEVLGGSATRLEAAQHVLDDLASRGVTGFRDSAGRNWSLESYVEMALRTSTGRAAIQGHLDSLAASGMDLVIVQEAPRHCPVCSPWNRQILSISGQVGAVIEPSAITGNPVTVTVAGSVEAARAAGWGHPNCRCTLAAYTVGVTKIGDRNPAGNAAAYEAGQRQREIERHIREWKRRQTVSLDDVSARRAAAKVREWQAALRAHVDANDLQRLSRREQIGKAR